MSDMECQPKIEEDKESFGYSLSQGKIGTHPTIFQDRLLGSEVKLKLEESPATSTGSCASPLLKRRPSIRSRKSLEPLHIVSSVDQNQQQTTAGKKIQEYQTASLNWERNQSEETQLSTGNQYGLVQSPEPWKPFPLRFEWSVTGRFRPLQVIIQSVRLLKGNALYSGVKQVTTINQGTGKSRRAWSEATLSAYCKDPRTKFWCGYTTQSNVVLDEFRGGIDISHVLRWLDRYPVRVEIKGSSRPLLATTFWITSNLHLS